VLVGDTILRNYYTYPVGYVDSAYVYVGAYTSIRGSAGTSVTITEVTESTADGGSNVVTFSDGKTLTVKNGTKGSNGDDYVLTEADKNEIAQKAAALVPGGGGGSGGGGASIDVTAEVGQTIIVKEVDANGKPTKWESADYQPRTHYEKKVEILPETEGVFLEDMGGFFYQDLVFASNITYFITYNGTEYTCTAFEINGMVAVGNLGMMDETFPNTGEPFLVASGAELGGSIFMPLDGAETVKAAIAESKPVKIPPKYIPTLEDMRTEEVVLFNEDIYEGYIGDVDINLTVGETYKINLGGAEYSCVALDATSMGAPGGIVMGNIDLAMGTGDSGDPFVLSYFNRELNVQMVDGSSLDGQMTKITIKGNVYTPIPKKYLANAFPYYIEVSGSGTTDDPYTCNETYDEITELFSSGKDIRIRRKMYNGDGSLLGETIYFYNWSMAFTYRFDNIMTGGWATDPFYININPGERTFTINNSMSD
jgi:hypothetical protein